MPEVPLQINSEQQNSPKLGTYKNIAVCKALLVKHTLGNPFGQQQKTGEDSKHMAPTYFKRPRIPGYSQKVFIRLFNI